MKNIVNIGVTSIPNLNGRIYLSGDESDVVARASEHHHPVGITDPVPWKLERDTSGEQALYSDSTRDLITTKSGFTYPEPKRRRR